MILTITERLAVMNLIPQKGDFVTLKRASELRDKLIVTEKEQKDLDFKVIIDELKPENTRVQCNNFNYETEIEIGEISQELIAKELKRLDAKKELTAGLVGIYEKFVDKKEEKE